MLTSLAYIFVLALLLGYLFNKLRLPSLLGMLLTGVVLGPHVAGVISPSLLGISAELRQVALVIILLRVGLALDVNDLKKVGRPAILMCFVPACFEIFGVMLIAPSLLGVTLLEAAIIGSVVAAVSPAIIVPKMLYLIENKIGTKKHIPQIIMAAGSVDGVFVIVLFTAFVALELGGDISPITLIQIPISIIMGLLVGGITGWLLSIFFKSFHIRDTIKLLLLVSVSFLFITLENCTKDIVAISGLLAIMAMGATIFKAHSVLAKRISPKFSKLWIGAEIILFVMVGTTLDLEFVSKAGVAVVALVFFAMIFRMIGVAASTTKTKLTINEQLFCMIAYIPKATVQAAIGSLPLAMGLPCGKIVLTVAVLAILITAPLGALGIDLTYKKLLSASSNLHYKEPIPTDNIEEELEK